MEGASTVKMVIVVHRHGARLPNKCVTRDLSWPKNKKFYDNYSGHLSPVGCQMLVDIGASFKQRYLEGSELFAGVAKSRLHKYVVVYTSNMQRTLFSAWSFLHGMFPGVPKHFSYASDRLKVNLKLVKKMLARREETLGIPIYIEEVARTDRLFHQYKMNAEIVEWQKKNVALSPTLTQIAKTSEFSSLVSKLFKMTRLPQLAPEAQMVEKMTVMKRVQTQINIANSHGLPLLPNKEGLRLESEELLMVKRIACEIWKLLYQPALGTEKADGMGLNAASHLAHYITQLMMDRFEGKNKLRVAEYSAHDTTLLALAARLGIDIPPPEFAGYFLFELHISKDAPEDPFVKFFYNQAPEIFCVNSLVARKLDFSEKIQEIGRLPEGGFALHRMAAECQTNGMRKSTRILRKLCKVRRPHFKTSAHSQHHILSMMSELARGEFKMVFQMWDREGKGYLTIEDLGSALRLMGKHPSKEHLKQLIDLFQETSSSDEEKRLDFNDFLRMMVLCELKDSEDSDEQPALDQRIRKSLEEKDDTELDTEVDQDLEVDVGLAAKKVRKESFEERSTTSSPKQLITEESMGDLTPESSFGSRAGAVRFFDPQSSKRLPTETVLRRNSEPLPPQKGFQFSETSALNSTQKKPRVRFQKSVANALSPGDQLLVRESRLDDEDEDEDEEELIQNRRRRNSRIMQDLVHSAVATAARVLHVETPLSPIPSPAVFIRTHSSRTADSEDVADRYSFIDESEDDEEEEEEEGEEEEAGIASGKLLNSKLLFR